VPKRFSIASSLLRIYFRVFLISPAGVADFGVVKATFALLEVLRAAEDKEGEPSCFAS